MAQLMTYVLVAVVVLFTGYFALYFSIVNAREEWMHAGNAAIIIKEPEYRFGGEFAAAFFKPAYQIDRRIRRAFWK
jgi:hypothetical protein